MMNNEEVLIDNIENTDQDNVDFSNELSMLDTEIDTLEGLYSQVKKHYDAVQNSHAKGSLVFLSKQASNLVAIKQAKISVIKEKINAKKLVKELQVKYNPSDDNDTIDDNIRSFIQAQINASKRDSNNQEEVYYEESDIDDYLESRIANENIKILNVTNDKDSDKITLNELMDMDRDEDDIETVDEDNSEGVSIEEDNDDVLMVDDKYYSDAEGNLYILDIIDGEESYVECDESINVDYIEDLEEEIDGCTSIVYAKEGKVYLCIE